MGILAKNRLITVSLLAMGYNIQIDTAPYYIYKDKLDGTHGLLPWGTIVEILRITNSIDSSRIGTVNPFHKRAII